MATKAQIAARKKFAEMAKSGKLASLRKKGAKKTARKTNPVKPKPKGASFAVVRGNSPAVKTNPRKRKTKKTAAKATRIPVGRATPRHGVFAVNGNGTAGRLIADFGVQKEAIEYANAYAKAHGVQLLVS